MTLSIILIEPQLGENIGMCARAMLNCGLTDLRLVRPIAKWPGNAKAKATAAGADEVIDNAKVFASTKEAVADLEASYAMTARRRDMVKVTYKPRSFIEEIAPTIDENHRVGVIFGSESSGLVNEDVALCEGVITVPLNPEFSSLNLAQSVLTIAYEWHQYFDDTQEKTLHVRDTRLAKKQEVIGFFEQLEKELDKSGFYRVPEKKPQMVLNLRNIFTRCELTIQEVQTLRGVVSSLISLKGSKYDT